MRYLILLISCLLGFSVLSGQGGSRQGKDYALFFAVDDYAHMGQLTNPVANATAIAKELKENYYFQTEVVANPTFAQVAAKIAEYQQRFASGAYDQKGQLLVFFTGHGVERGNNGYFIPADGNPNRLYENVLEYDYWRSEIDLIDCQHILVTIDACYSLTFDPNWRNKTDRNFGRRVDKQKDQVKLDHEQYRARLFITSDGTGNQTPDRSSLARQFLTALRTHRGANGYLPSEELYASYLRNAAPVPGGGNFGRDEPGSRFLFFRKQVIIKPDARADIAAWNKAKAANDCAGYRAYLSAFPGGDFVGVARLKVDDCDVERRMLSAWATAKETGTRAAYAKFLQDYPNSPYQDAAELAARTVGRGNGSTSTDRNDNLKVNPPDNMVFVKGGTFQMGDQFGDGSIDEKPVHAVTLSDFYLSRTELTFAEYDRFCKATGRYLPDDKGWGRDQRPVINVSWLDAVAYCNWWSEQSGYTPVYRISGYNVTANWNANGYRLPTEAEWEYAARSGGKKEKWAGTSTESSLSQFANYGGEEDGYERTAPVGSLRANNLGLADMSGNVWEWCWDWRDSGYYGKSPASNPLGPNSGTKRVIRDGGWSRSPSYCRAALRSFSGPSHRSYFVGFRLARSF